MLFIKQLIIYMNFIISFDNLLTFEEKVINFVTIYKRTLSDFNKNYPNQKKKLSLLKYSNLNKIDSLVNK